MLRLLLLAVAAVLLMLGLPPGGRSVPETALPVTSSLQTGSDENFARLTVVSEDEISLEQAWVLVNGHPVGSLSGGRLPVRVYDGDQLSLDCRAYGRELTFHLAELSADIDPDYLQLELTCKNELASLGFVVIRQL